MGRSRARGNEIPRTIDGEFVAEARGVWTLGLSVKVMRTGVLKVEPGAVIQCEPDALLEVEGQLLAGAEPEKGSRRIQWVQFRPRGRGRKPWVGITLAGKKRVPASVLKYCKFTGASRAVWVTEGEATIDSCVFTNNTIGVVLGRSAGPRTKVTMTNCRIDRSKEDGIQIFGQAPRIERCTIERNGGAGILIDFASRPFITTSIITHNIDGGVVSKESRYDARVKLTKCHVHDNHRGLLDIANRTAGKWICTEDYLGPKASRVLSNTEGEINLDNVEDAMDNMEYGEVQLRPYADEPYDSDVIGAEAKIR